MRIGWEFVFWNILGIGSFFLRGCMLSFFVSGWFDGEDGCDFG